MAQLDNFHEDYRGLMQKINKSMTGKRILVNTTFNSYVEITIIEISPSGKRAKAGYPSGVEGWVDIEDYEVVEILK